MDARSVINWTVVGHAMLTVPATVDRWFITVIVKLYLQHDSVARVHLQQRILVYCGHD